MEAHYTYIGEFVADHDSQEFISGIILFVLILLLGKVAASRLSTRQKREQHIVPDSSFGLHGFFDFFVESFLSYHDSILGKENRRYASFSGSIFMFLLASNLIGLFPGMAAITTTVWINVGMALVVFIYFNYMGFREHGFWGYLKHFAGPVWFLAWFLFPIEVFSALLRILTLNLRLYWNIQADHLVLGIFTELGKLAAFPVYILGTFVSFMQAFIFTTLTMVYILLAVQHEEEH